MGLVRLGSRQSLSSRAPTAPPGGLPARRRVGAGPAVLAGLRVVAVGVLAAACGLARPAAAADVPPADPATALDATLRQHVKEKALEAVKDDAKQVGKAWPSLDPKGRKTLGATLLWLTKAVTDDGVQKVVIDVVGETRDKALSAVLRPFLAMPDKKAAPPLLRPAIEAAGKLADEDLVVPLMGIVKDAKDYDVAATALKAFAGYGTAKKARNGILRDLINTVAKDQPGVGKRWEKDGDSGPYETARTKTGDEQLSRYQALSAALVPTLNTLTGQNCGTAEDWFGLFDRYKSAPGDLFAR